MYKIFGRSIALSFCFSLLFFGVIANAAPFVESTKAGHNFSGWAWSENFGWISFNSSNCDANGDTNVDDATICAQPKSPTSPYNPVALPQYGVNVQYSTGALSGYAWSEYAGWISFQASHGATVAFNKADKTFDGMAKVYNLAADMQDLDFKVGVNTYGVKTINNESDPNYGKLNGWAWNGNGNAGATKGVGIGWLSFNSADVGAGGGPYQVYFNPNHTPIATGQRIERTDPGPTENIFDLATPVLSIGDTASFIAAWNNNGLGGDDTDNGDYVRMFACKTSAPMTITVDDPNTSHADLDAYNAVTICGGPGNIWCTSGSVNSNGGEISCSNPAPLSGPAKPDQRFYATVCDQFGYCSAPRASDPFLLNDRPTVGGAASAADSSITSGGSPNIPVVTAPPLDGVNDVGFGENDSWIEFSATWSDSYTGGKMTMFACATNSFDDDHSNPHCTGTQWCQATDDPVAASGINVPINGCRYNATDPDLSGPRNYYIFACDAYGACTAETDPVAGRSGQFLINRRPQVASGMSAPNFVPNDAQANPYTESDLRANLIWQMNDASDSNPSVLTDAYLWVKDGANPGRQGKDFDFDLDGIAPFGDKACQSILNGSCDVRLSDRGQDSEVTDILNWNTAYTWSTRVKDRYAWSEARDYNHISGGDVLTDDASGIVSAINGGSATTFTTYAHNFPIVNSDPACNSLVGSDIDLNDKCGVVYFPAVPSAMEEVKATPRAYCYEDNEPSESRTGDGIINIAKPCDGSVPAVGTGEYTWSAAPSNAVEFKQISPLRWESSLTTRTPGFSVLRFKEEGDGAGREYTLTVYDKDDYFDTNLDATINYVNERLPSWKEVK